jgi:LAO/AO transport system kinase
VTAADILSGDRRALARAATLVESGQADKLLADVFPHTGKALILGITGSPGAGKSTLVDQLAQLIRTEEKTVAIVAVDPSSPFSGGAILGDRVRMMRHHADPGVFIRSMATRGAMGGLAATTADMTTLLDAAGFEFVIVETVGVGQDEVDVARLATVTAVVLVPGMGDDIQAVKAGLMEVADIFVINKTDREGAARLEQELHAADLNAPVIRTVATEGTGLPELLAVVRAIPAKDRAVERWRHRLREMLRDKLLKTLSLEELDSAARAVADRRRDPYSVVDEFLKRLSH